jgi:hypothetical protein
MEITELDKKRIKLDIKISLLLSFIFFGAIMLLILVVCIFVFFLTNPIPGYLNRFLYIESIFALCFLAFQWNNLLKYFDLKKGKKIRVETENYQIKSNKKSLILRTKNPDLKFQISNDLLPLIDINKMLYFEFTQSSKTLLFLSNDNVNLLEVIEKEKDSHSS